MGKKEENLIDKVINSVREEGISGCLSRTGKFAARKIKLRKRSEAVYKDVLFISGCREDLPHPWRYRVAHQREQMESCHMSTEEVYYQDLTMEQLLYYRIFVFFRCPYTELIGKFVAVAKKLNKPVLYDVDDLVIDTKYTDLIPFVQRMKAEDKYAYDQNVRDMQRLLKSCDLAITTTKCLGEELKNYVPDIYVNRNTASEEMVNLSQDALRLDGRIGRERVKIGYFSGSITHNADVEMILPVLIKILAKHKTAELHLVGELDIPQELKQYQSQIVRVPFTDWRKLPEMLVEIDINLAPLEDTLFNRAKSENKWVEAALVKTVTVASDVGAFHDCIQNEETGILCKTAKEWEEALECLITDEGYRKQIAENAYAFCMANCTTIRSGTGIVHFLDEKIKGNYCFVLPGLEISGGIKVALKHAAVLQKNGGDVTLLTLDGKNTWYTYEKRRFPVISLKKTEIVGRIGCAVATMWTTVAFVEQYPNIRRRCYLVQNFETDFYKEGDALRLEANKTYMPYNRTEFLTISKWCQKWLKENYYQDSLYMPNGLETERFAFKERKMTGKIRILIEGDCAVEYKNVDEAFRIVEKLDPKKYEVWYMSYNGEPKEWYRVDRFLHKVPYEEVPQIYAACDILLKTSILESFSYPPLEMMATGGYVVAVPNGGNVEYLEDEYNCLFYQKGNIKEAKQKIERICSDRKLRDTLSVNGRKTAELRTWDYIEPKILDTYDVWR